MEVQSLCPTSILWLLASIQNAHGSTQGKNHGIIRVGKDLEGIKSLSSQHHHH